MLTAICEAMNDGASHAMVSLKVKSPNEMTRSIQRPEKTEIYAPRPRS